MRSLASTLAPTLLLPVLTAGCASHLSSSLTVVERAVGRSAYDVPIELQRGMPIVEFQTQGRTLRMIVDLGGTHDVAMIKSTLRELDVHFTGRSTFVSSAFGVIRRSREFILPEARLAELSLRNLHGYEVHDERLQIPGPPGESPTQYDGYIGIGLLRQFNLLVDYPNDRIVLSAHDSDPPVDVDSWPSSSFRDGRQGVISPIHLNGTRMLANWDTGANHTVIRANRVEASRPRWSFNEHQDAVTFESLAIGGFDIGSFDLVLMDFRQPNVTVILGTNLFERRAVWFDFSMRRLWIDPVGRSE
jgi:hypothetical protein